MLYGGRGHVFSEHRREHAIVRQAQTHRTHTFCESFPFLWMRGRVARHATRRSSFRLPRGDGSRVAASARRSGGGRETPALGERGARALSRVLQVDGPSWAPTLRSGAARAGFRSAVRRNAHRAGCCHRCGLIDYTRRFASPSSRRWRRQIWRRVLAPRANIYEAQSRPVTPSRTGEQRVEARTKGHESIGSAVLPEHDGAG